MNALNKKVIAGLLLVALTACGTSEDSAASFVESGKELLAEGKTEKARLEFKNAIQVDPRQAAPYYQLALIDEKDQKWRGMFANLTTVEQLDPNHHEAIIKLGQIYLLSNNFEVASEKANKVIGADNSNILAWVLRASIFMKQEQFDAAMSDINQALSLDAENIEALSVKTLILNLQGQAKQALAVIDQALELEPEQLPLTMIKISILEQQKNYSEMESIYRALQLKYNDASWVVISLAKLFNSQGRYDDAKQVLTAFVADNGDDLQAKLLLVSLIETKSSAEAIQLLDGYIEAQPDNFDLRFSRIRLYLDGNNIDPAIAELELVAEMDIDGSYARRSNVMLANFEFQQGEFDEANTRLSLVLSAEPEDEAALLLKARIELINKDIDAAVTDLRIVLRNNPDSDQAFVLLAQAYMNSGSSELADDNFRQALAANPSNVTAALSVANSMMQARDLNRTEEVLTNALKGSGDKEALLRALAQVKIMKKDWLGTESIVESLRIDKKDTALTYFLSGQISQGQAYYENAIEEYSAALEMRPDLTRALQGLAFSYLQLGQKEQLVSYLTAFLDKNPTQLSGYGVLSNVYMQNKEWENAVATIEQGLNQTSKWIGGYSALASIYFSQENTEQAIASYQRGLDENNGNIALTLQMASAYERSMQFSKAKTLYEEVLVKDENIEPAINNLASLLTDKFPSEDNLKAASILVERFKNSTEPYYLDTYAWTQLLLGNLSKSQPVLERVVSLSPNVAVFNYHLGALYLEQDNKIAAESYLTTAKDLAEKQGDSIMAKDIAELLSSL